MVRKKKTAVVIEVDIKIPRLKRVAANMAYSGKGGKTRLVIQTIAGYGDGNDRLVVYVDHRNYMATTPEKDFIHWASHLVTTHASMLGQCPCCHSGAAVIDLNCSAAISCSSCGFAVPNYKAGTRRFLSRRTMVQWWLNIQAACTRGGLTAP